MKKIIGILILTLFNAFVFGQIDYFNDESVVDVNYRDYIQKGNLNGLDDFYYIFEANDTKYMLAYDADEDDWKNGREYVTDPKLTRSLILYQFDGVDNWVKASNVIQVDYQDSEPYIYDGTKPHRYTTSMNKIIKKGLGTGQIEIHESGCVVMTITNIYAKPDKIYEYNRSDNSYTYKGKQVEYYKIEKPEYYYDAYVILVPNGDKTYTTTRFEPKDKRIDNFSKNLKITKVDDKLMLDVNTYHQAKYESKADTCVVFQGERDKAKKCFDVQNYATLLFKIQPDNTVNVLTSGKLDLVKKL